MPAIVVSAASSTPQWLTVRTDGGHVLVSSDGVAGFTLRLTIIEAAELCDALTVALNPKDPE